MPSVSELWGNKAVRLVTFGVLAIGKCNEASPIDPFASNGELVFESDTQPSLTLHCSTGLLLTCILVPISISRIEYYEYGLQIRTTTGKVDTSQVYEAGSYMNGPTRDFLRYPAVRNGFPLMI